MSTIVESLSKIQSELEDPAKTHRANTGKFTYNYTNLASFLPELRAIVAKHGCALVTTVSWKEGTIGVEASLLNGAEKISSFVPYPSEMPRDAQDAGKAQTYLRRYAILALFSLVAVEDDNDAAPRGATAQPPPSRPPAPPAPTRDRAERVSDFGLSLSMANRFLAHLDMPSVPAMTDTKFDAFIGWMQIEGATVYADWIEQEEEE